MEYAPYSSEFSMPPPPPSLNGGLYTGEPFAKDAPWRNFPAIPDAGYLIHYNLRSANPPPDAIYQYPGNVRPGNNYQTMPGVTKGDPRFNQLCNKAACKYETMQCPCHKCKFAKYSYL